MLVDQLYVMILKRFRQMLADYSLTIEVERIKVSTFLVKNETNVALL